MWCFEVLCVGELWFLIMGLKTGFVLHSCYILRGSIRVPEEIPKMSEVKKWENLGIDLTLKVSRHSGGFYLRVEKPIAESLGLKSGMLVQVKLKKKGVTE